METREEKMEPETKHESKSGSRGEDEATGEGKGGSLVLVDTRGLQAFPPQKRSPRLGNMLKGKAHALLVSLHSTHSPASQGAFCGEQAKSARRCDGQARRVHHPLTLPAEARTKWRATRLWCSRHRSPSTTSVQHPPSHLLHLLYRISPHTTTALDTIQMRFNLRSCRFEYRHTGERRPLVPFVEPRQEEVCSRFIVRLIPNNHGRVSSWRRDRHCLLQKQTPCPSRPAPAPREESVISISYRTAASP